MSKIKVVNDFWITGDILVMLPNGPAHETLRLTSTSADATKFGRKSAQAVAQFIAGHLETVYDSLGRPIDIIFKPEPSETVKGLWVVRGTQEVEVDPES